MPLAIETRGAFAIDLVGWFPKCGHRFAGAFEVGRGRPPNARNRHARGRMGRGPLPEREASAQDCPGDSIRCLPADVDGPVPEPAAVGVIDGAALPAISSGRRGDDRPRRDACGRSRHDRGRPPAVVPDAATPIAGAPGPAGARPWAWPPSRLMPGTGVRPPNSQAHAIAPRRAGPPQSSTPKTRPQSSLPTLP
jgi:hypothetical protein